MNEEQILNAVMPHLTTFLNNCEVGNPAPEGLDPAKSWASLAQKLEEAPDEVLNEESRVIESHVAAYFDRAGLDIRKVTLGEWLDLNKAVRAALRAAWEEGTVYVVTVAREPADSGRIGTGTVVSVHRTEEGAKAHAVQRLRQQYPNDGIHVIRHNSGGLVVHTIPRSYHVTRQSLGE